MSSPSKVIDATLAFETQVIDLLDGLASALIDLDQRADLRSQHLVREKHIAGMQAKVIELKRILFAPKPGPAKAEK